MPTLDDALHYAAFGIPVFPLVGKRPLEIAGQENIDGLVIPEGKGGFHQATIDVDKVTRWWTAYPNANIGTPTGKHFDAITGEPNAHPFDVLDIDTGSGGMASLQVLLADNGLLPDTWLQITGTGGQHYCFVSDGTVRNSAGGIAPGIDVRGTGGYIVVDPSEHPKTLELYRWENAPWSDVPLALWPDWLRQQIKATSRKRNTGAGARIPLGVQEATLTRIAGSMRRTGATETEILAALRVISQERCDPQVDERNLERIARSISNYEPGEPLIDFAIDDSGNAERLVIRYGEHIRHASDAKAADAGWYAFDGRVWRESVNRVMQFQLETARAYQDAAANLPVPEDDADALKFRKAHMANARLCAQEKGMVSARKIAASFPDIDIARTEFDADPWAFACANGVIDLRTGELKEHHADDLITRASPVTYDPDAKLELWESFLTWLTKDRPELRHFLQLAAGYSMTGDVREEKLFFIHGPAASGKSTFVEALKATFGDYAMTADFSTFLKGHTVGNARPDIAEMSGARYVSSIEVEQGKALATGLVKQMTGGDSIRARFLYQNNFEFGATHKLWLVANDAPKVNNEDDGIWRRILRIPCDNVLPEAERDAVVKLRLRDPNDAGPAILAWAVAGAVEWASVGKIIVPDTIRAATADYRESQDPITDFLAEACEITPEGKTTLGDLLAAYHAYCKMYHRKPMGRNTFSQRLRDRGFEQTRQGGSGVQLFKGLQLAAPE